MRGGKRDPQLVGEAAEPGTWLERAMKRSILVHTLADMSIRGVLMEKAEDGLILRAARLLSDDAEGSGTALAGETFIPHAQVHFCQLDD